MLYWNWKEGEEIFIKRNFYILGRILNLFLFFSCICFVVEKFLVYYFEINVNYYFCLFEVIVLSIILV